MGGGVTLTDYVAVLLAVALVLLGVAVVVLWRAP